MYEEYIGRVIIHQHKHFGIVESYLRSFDAFLVKWVEKYSLPNVLLDTTFVLNHSIDINEIDEFTALIYDINNEVLKQLKASPTLKNIKTYKELK